ncbi:MAG: DUF6772 family protein [Armatimonadota bacterium]|nr:DUF6772 family protein [Armatimonadota bacterium]
MQRAPELLSPALSRFDPLPRILFFADFDGGLNGYTALIGNYEGSLDSLLPEYRDLRPPMLSNLSMWDTGSAGGLDGTYALKLATRPQAGSLAVAVKRLTWRRPGRIQFEAYFTFKPEATELQLSNTDVRAVGFGLDLQDGDRRTGARRVMPHLRYLNALGGQMVERWQFKRAPEPMHEIGTTGKTRSHFHLAPTGWEDVPDGHQQLCYNEIATKQNWHYVRFGFDLDAMAFTAFQCNDRTFDPSGIAPMMLGAMPNLWCMLNPFMWVETDLDKRAFLYVDSVLLSAE